MAPHLNRLPFSVLFLTCAYAPCPAGIIFVLCRLDPNPGIPYALIKNFSLEQIGIA